MKTITFENSGQPFLEWDLDERQVVIACRPEMAAVWLGTVVLTRPLAPGRTLEVSLPGTGAIRRLIHRVQSVQSRPARRRASGEREREERHGGAGAGSARVTQFCNMKTKDTTPKEPSPELTTPPPTPSALTRRELRKAATLLARHVRAAESAKALFLRSSKLLNEVIAAGVPVSVPIVLRSGRTVVLRDQFAGKNEAFAPKVFHRFKVEDYKEPRAGRTAAAATGGVAQAASA